MHARREIISQKSMGYMQEERSYQKSMGYMQDTQEEVEIHRCFLDYGEALNLQQGHRSQRQAAAGSRCRKPFNSMW